jgi:phosphoglycerol transferase MdoB-like AlkP superfamily enzyme
MPDEKANNIVQEIHFVEKDTTVTILDKNRPNIVVIFLESWSGDLVESLGGVPGITPEFRKLEREGMLFTQFFASGNRSQQALASVFGGAPALPVTTLTDHPEKYPAIPSLVKNLKKEGYFTSFYFGGDLNYGNIRSYLVYNEFDKLVEEKDFSAEAVKGKLGFHDEVLFDRLLDELDEQQEPFFTATLTLSSHSPYDQPGERPIDWIDVENDYINSAWYTDKCLGEFFDAAREKSWYENTLFIVMADHSHVSYNNYQWWSFNYRRIPLLLLGGALSEEFENSTNERICTNVDITSTLLKQLQLPDEEFFWSKNLFNPYTPEFANFELNDGFGWMRPMGRLEYNVVVPLILSSDVKGADFDKLKLEGEAYYQVLFKEFLGY